MIFPTTHLCQALCEAHKNLLEILVHTHQLKKVMLYLLSSAEDWYVTYDPDIDRYVCSEIVLYQQEDMRIVLETETREITAYYGDNGVIYFAFLLASTSEDIDQIGEKLWRKAQRIRELPVVRKDEEFQITVSLLS